MKKGLVLNLLLIATFSFLLFSSISPMESENDSGYCCSAFTNFFWPEETPESGNKPLQKLYLPEPIIEWKWQQKCNKINKENPSETPLQKDELGDELDFFCLAMNKELSSDPFLWIDKNPSKDFFNLEATNHFEPYVQKLEVEADAEVAFHGDIHGDVHSLNAYIAFLVQKGYLDPEDPFKIIKSKFYMIFLGDYIDRGSYGAEVIYTILRLKRSNPHKVFLVRGNHEDIKINKAYDFSKELQNKFGTSKDLLATIGRMYNYLPVALYLVSGKNALLCCHGGLEVGFTESKKLLENAGKIRCILLGNLNRKTCCNDLPEQLDYIKKYPEISDFTPTSPTAPQAIGFMWYDFDVDNYRTLRIANRGLECDKKFTDYVLQQQSTSDCIIRGVFRAHQHGGNKMMQLILNADKTSHDTDIGVAKLWMNKDKKYVPQALWDGIVCTFSVSPNTQYGDSYKFNFDSFGILKTAEKFDQWRLSMHRISMKK